MKLPDLVTLLNALCGITAILLTLTEPTYLAPLLILIAAVADGLDGHIARKFSSSDIGSNLDSLADVISFGVTPVVITYAFSGNGIQYIVLLSMMFYLVCGILRLARFNTMHQELDSFSGLPITAGGIVISSYLLMGGTFFNIYIIAALGLILGLLMVSDIPYMKVRNKTLLTPLTIIFAATIISYSINIEYTHILAALLTGIMAIYMLSPIIKRTT